MNGEILHLLFHLSKPVAAVVMCVCVCMCGCIQTVLSGSYENLKEGERGESIEILKKPFLR